MPPHRLTNKKSDAHRNYFLGTQAIFAPKWKSYRIPPFEGHGYDEPGWDMLTELRTAVKGMGCQQFKFKLGDSTCQSYQLPNCNGVSSLKELAEVPEVAATLADPDLIYYHIWTYSFANPKPFASPLTEKKLAAEYKETYDLAVHLLTEYKKTDKVFLIGNWEGDWELMWASDCRCNGKFDFCKAPTDEIIERYTQWAQTRQRAIDNAKRDVDASGVDMFYYIEFNLECENFDSKPDGKGKKKEKGHDHDHKDCRPTMLNSVVPQVNPDFLSYSSYKSTNKYMEHKGKFFKQKQVDERFWKILDYAESKLQDKKGTDFSAICGDGRILKRVFIGEFGATRTCDPALFCPSVAHVVRASLEWGCPFVLYWEVYDNDSETVPLVSRDCADLSTFSPIRQLFQDYAAASKTHVDELHEEDGKFVTQKDLRKWAIEYFQKVIDSPADHVEDGKFDAHSDLGKRAIECLKQVIDCSTD